MFAPALPPRFEVMDKFYFSFADRTARGEELTQRSATLAFDEDLPRTRLLSSKTVLHDLVEDHLTLMARFALDQIMEASLVSVRPSVKTRRSAVKRFALRRAVEPIRDATVVTSFDTTSSELTMSITAPENHAGQLLDALEAAGYQPIRDDKTDSWTVRII